jgi:glycosyltransferase involved in cell wall biosynthesis
MPEVASDAVLLVNPYNIGEIAEAIQTVAGNSELRSRFRSLGLARFAQFT